MLDVPEVLYEDSSDLSDAEVASAKESTTPDKPIDPAVVCHCGTSALPCAYALRRRKPYVYWRVKYLCEKGHETNFLYRVGRHDQV